MVAGLESSDKLFDDRDLAEVIVPHGGITLASIGRIAITVGLLAEFVKGSLNIGGTEPFFATAGVGEGRNRLNVCYPRTATVIAAEEPVVLAIVRREAIEGHFADEFGIGCKGAEWFGKIGGLVGVDRDELRSAFAGVAKASVGVEWGMRNFFVEVTAELTGVKSVAIRLHGEVRFGSTREEKIGVRHSDAFGGVGRSDLTEDRLEADGESSGRLGITFTKPLETTTGLIMDVVGHIMPEAFGTVLVIATNFNALLGGDVSDSGGTTTTKLENFGKTDDFTIKGGFVSGVEAGV